MGRAEKKHWQRYHCYTETAVIYIIKKYRNSGENVYLEEFSVRFGRGRLALL